MLATCLLCFCLCFHPLMLLMHSLPVFSHQRIAEIDLNVRQVQISTKLCVHVLTISMENTR